MYLYRSSISHDNIDNVSEILANFFNRYMEYMDPQILNWCRCRNVINDNTKNILSSKDLNFQRFVDAITSQNINPTNLTLTDNIQAYQRIFPNNLTSIVTFMKFVLGITYLLNNFNATYFEDVCPFIGITYFVYSNINHSPLLNSNLDDKSLILQDIRNLWSIFLFRKTTSHSNLNGEWDVLVRETQRPFFTDSRRVNLTPAFNIIDFGTTRVAIPLSIYIQNSLIQTLNDVLNI
ncbi:hypothetical protein RclHR1_06930003 [Rhizophagus clarus]|uniref:Uncharacterized protein n=1 Tax=Rhizophagus clarus TaxID=94130 RepID=A0A2Z6RV04_9GLOM|nr:hypothetical protein RclHR1_06930003 [Rhizophagus clarus]GES99786.1 hypothetical protein GLOIN_2v1871175 [Rhizophagus clarus]